jgi:hypothetical protein
MRAVSPPLYAECTQPWFTKYIAPAGKWVHFVSAHDDANSMVDEIDPGQSFLRVNVLRWREIFRMIETSSSNVDLIGPFVVLICQGRSTATAKRPPRSRLRPKSRWRSFHELELRMFHRNPGYCLSSSGSPAVLTMTIRPDTDLGRRAETHLATITATGNFILFHASHRKLGMSDRNRDNLLVGESRKRVQEIIADNLSKAGWSWGCVSAVDSNRRTIWIAPRCARKRGAAGRCAQSLRPVQLIA